jgi:Domain of unknown function (DUF4915)
VTALLNPEARSTRRPRIDQAESSDYQVTASFVALLEQLGCSLVITNYQSSTVMTFSSLGNGKLVRMFAPFRTAMGLAIDGDRLAVAAQTEIVGLSNIRKLAPSLPKFPNLFDGYFVPRVRYTTGECSLHDMVFAGRDILAVNTAYTCICRIDGFARGLAYHGGYLFVDPPPPEPEPDAPRTPALAATR